MREFVIAAVLSVVAVGAASSQSAPQVDAPPLPAAFYDVEAANQLGWRPDPGLTPAEPGRSASFVVARDSILWRRGMQRAEIAIGDVIAVEEARWPAANQRAWVKVTYRQPSGDTDVVYFRQSNAQHSRLVLAAIRRAVDEHSNAARLPE